MMMALSYQKLNQKYWKKFPRERMAERKRHMLALSKPCILIEIHVKKGEVLRKKVNSATFSFSNKIHTEEQIHSNLDITNKSIRPFLFTLSNNSLHISYVICWVNPKNGSWVLFNISRNSLYRGSLYQGLSVVVELANRSQIVRLRANSSFNNCTVKKVGPGLWH